jgi:hypothetical protein
MHFLPYGRELRLEGKYKFRVTIEHCKQRRRSSYHIQQNIDEYVRNLRKGRL